MTELNLAGRRVGAGSPTYIIAEAGVNHNGSMELARGLVEAAAAVGADAVKFQTFRSEAAISRSAARAQYQRETMGEGSMLDMVRGWELSEDQHRELASYAHGKGLAFLSTPFDVASVELLDRLDVPAFKISSGDLTNPEILAAAASTGRPLILSTGMADLEEVLWAKQQVEGSAVAFLHCTSAYPAPPTSLNLRAISTLEKTTGCVVGYSDHSTRTWTGGVAVALGASIVEKHLTLDRALSGPDHRASLEPGDFASYVGCIREAWSGLGDGEKRMDPTEAGVRDVARRSVVAARDLPSGHILERKDVALKRPGTGIAARDVAKTLGRRLNTGVERDEVLTWSVLDP